MACGSCGGGRHAAGLGMVNRTASTVWRHTRPDGATVDYLTKGEADRAVASFGGSVDEVRPGGA